MRLCFYYIFTAKASNIALYRTRRIIETAFGRITWHARSREMERNHTTRRRAITTRIVIQSLASFQIFPTQ
ncbi:hypothetical protein SeLEV6574_g00773 [Synchytrium endobioticum]|uniref:Uncharacterized protein n=1 Tax=Synchytrium endobioticum TaxID=286115 RepID=A0A507DG20_9FUNG|nr:hypothetical protein SeLEV6574_g00773 [Synchytrium endobioticum]